MNDYYVYIYYRLDTNEPFYIGKGHGRRWKVLKRKNTHFNRVVEKYEVAVVIEKIGLTEQEAFYWEEKIIETLVFEYGFSIDIPQNRSSEEGYHLVNQTFGGEGASGHNPFENKTKEEMDIIKEKCAHYGENNYWYGKNPWDYKTEEEKERIRRKMSESHKGKKGVSRFGKDNPNYGNCWSSEQRKKQSEKLKGKFEGEKNPFYGKCHSKETKRKLGKPVICLTTKRIFYTAIDASLFYSCDNSNIVKCCKGKIKSCGKLSDGTSLKWKWLVWKHNKSYRIKRGE